MTIPELLSERARRLGDKPFIICDDREYSVEEVDANSRNVAWQLARHGARPGTKIVLITGNCMEFIYVFLGAGNIGAVIVPVNPTMQPEEVAYIIQNSDAEIVIAVAQFAPLLASLKSAAPKVKKVFLIGGTAEGAEPFEALLEPCEALEATPACAEDLAALIYTSGTTGAPKGVMLTHANYIWDTRTLVHAVHVSPDYRFLCVLPLFHVNAQVTSILTPLFVGGDTVLMTRFNPFDILPMLEKYRCTIMSAVPTIYAMLCRIPNVEQYDLDSVRYLVTGAAPLLEETYKAVQRVLKKPLLSGYGLTEATCGSAVAYYRHPVKWDSVGFVIPYTSMRIIDEQGKDVAQGEVGQVLLGGPTIMKGYYKNPEATAEVLKGGWLYTGDLGRLDEEGYLYIVGRIKDMIIRGGQNVYPEEIENVLLGLPGVEEACVIGVPDPEWGQEILALVKPADGADLTEQQVADHCRERLAPYKRPRIIRFAESFPKTATGKIRKGEVAKGLGY